MNQITITIEDDEMYERLLSLAKEKGMALESYIIEQLAVMVAANESPSRSRRVVTDLSDEMTAKRRKASVTGDVEEIRELAKETDYSLLMNLGCNPATPLDILDKIACNEEWQVRGSVLCNENLPESLLQKLMNDPNERVSRDAKVNADFKNRLK